MWVIPSSSLPLFHGFHNVLTEMVEFCKHCGLWWHDVVVVSYTVFPHFWHALANFTRKVLTTQISSMTWVPCLATTDYCVGGVTFAPSITITCNSYQDWTQPPELLSCLSGMCDSLNPPSMCLSVCWYLIMYHGIFPPAVPKIWTFAEEHLDVL